MDREELFYKYQNNLRRLEDEQEILARKKRKFEDKKERARARQIEARAHVEVLVNMWGNCEDSGNFIADFEDSVEEQHKELEKKEQQLQEEVIRIRKEVSACESWYENECRQSSGEEDIWQE